MNQTQSHPRPAPPAHSKRQRHWQPAHARLPHPSRLHGRDVGAGAQTGQAGVPLQLHGVGVVCHHHQEQVTQGYVRNFNLTQPGGQRRQHRRHRGRRPHAPADHAGAGRVRKAHARHPAALVQGNQAQLDEMGGAGGSHPGRHARGGRQRAAIAPPCRASACALMAVVPGDPGGRENEFRQWRRQWLPGFALVGVMTCWPSAASAAHHPARRHAAGRPAACGPLQLRASRT